MNSGRPLEWGAPSNANDPEMLAVRDELKALGAALRATGKAQVNAAEANANHPADESTACHEDHPGLGWRGSRTAEIAQWVGRRRGRRPTLSEFTKGQLVGLLAVGIPFRAAARLLSIERSAARRALEGDDQMRHALEALAGRLQGITRDGSKVARDLSAKR